MEKNGSQTRPPLDYKELNKESGIFSHLQILALSPSRPALAKAVP
jgi:hypothetical protein